MSRLDAHPAEETDGLDEASANVPAPNAASEFTTDYALPGVVPRRVDALAWVAFVLAFCLPFVAIPLAHRVIRRLQHDGGRGRRLAQAAVLVGYLCILALAFLALNVVIALVF